MSDDINDKYMADYQQEFDMSEFEPEKITEKEHAKTGQRVPYGRERACGCIPQFIGDLG